MRTLILSCCLAIIMNVVHGQSNTVSLDPYAYETIAERNSRMEWFRIARFGMFIHWGVYAVPAGIHKGKKIDGLGEWIMSKGSIPMK